MHHQQGIASFCLMVNVHSGSETFLRLLFCPLCKLWHEVFTKDKIKTIQSKHCGFSIYIFDNSKSKSMVRLVRAEKMVLSGLVFARKIARMNLNQNI